MASGNEENKNNPKNAPGPKVGIGAWIALALLIIVLSGAFRTSESALKVLDFTNLSGNFGTIGDTGAKARFMAGLNLIPAVMLFCGLLGIFEQLGALQSFRYSFQTASKTSVRHGRYNVFL